MFEQVKVKSTHYVQRRDAKGRFAGRALMVTFEPVVIPTLSEAVLPLWEENQRFLALTPTDFRRDVYTRVHV